MAKHLPIADQLALVLAEYSTVTVSLLNSLTSTRNQSSANIPSLLASLANVDHRLADLCHLAREHDRNHSRIVQLQKALSESDNEWKNDIRNLYNLKCALADALKVADQDKLKMKESAEANVDATALLSLGRLLAPFTSAPPRDTSQPFDVQNLAAATLRPPFPTEEAMRRGRLAFGDHDEVGQTRDAVGAQGPDEAQVQEPKTSSLPTVQQAPKPLPKRPKPQEVEEFDFDFDLNPDL